MGALRPCLWRSLARGDFRFVCSSVFSSERSFQRSNDGQVAVERNANVAIDARCVAVVPLFVNVVVVVVNVERNKVD